MNNIFAAWTTSLPLCRELHHEWFQLIYIRHLLQAVWIEQSETTHRTRSQWPQTTISTLLLQRAIAPLLMHLSHKTIIDLLKGWSYSKLCSDETNDHKCSEQKKLSRNIRIIWCQMSTRTYHHWLYLLFNIRILNVHKYSLIYALSNSWIFLSPTILSVLLHTCRETMNKWCSAWNIIESNG